MPIELWLGEAAEERERINQGPRIFRRFRLWRARRRWRFKG